MGLGLGVNGRDASGGERAGGRGRSGFSVFFLERYQILERERERVGKESRVRTMVNTLIRTGNKGILQSLVLVVLVCAGIITTTYIGLNTGYIRPDMSRYMAEWTDRCCLSPSEYPWPCPYTPGSAEVCMTGGDVLTQPLANATVDFCSSHELGEDLFNRNETDVITLCATSEGYSDDVKGNEGYVDCVYVPIPVCVDGCKLREWVGYERERGKGKKRRKWRERLFFFGWE